MPCDLSSHGRTVCSNEAYDTKVTIAVSGKTNDIKMSRPKVLTNTNTIH